MRTTERACPFCGVALALTEAIAELRLVSRLDRHRMVALGAVLSAAGIALGCREAPVAIYGAPAAPHEVTSAAPPAPPVAEPAPALTPSVTPTSLPSTAPAAPSASATPPAPVPAPASQPQPSASGRPFAPAAAYGAPPSTRPSPGIVPAPAKPGF